MRAHACTRQRSEGAQPHVSASLCHRLITSSEHGCLEERHSTTCGRPIMSPSRRPNGASRRVSSVKGTRVRVGCSGDPLEALPRALCLASQISSMDEIWLRGAGSTHNMRLAGLQRCQPTRLVAQDVWPYEGRAGGHKGALPRAPGLVSQISSIDEIWLRGAGSTHNEPLTAPQRCQPTRIVGLGY